MLFYHRVQCLCKGQLRTGVTNGATATNCVSLYDLRGIH